MKFDFLGLRTLTIIKWALEMINERLAREGKEPIRIETIPLDDKNPLLCCWQLKLQQYSSLNHGE